MRVCISGHYIEEGSLVIKSELAGGKHMNRACCSESRACCNKYRFFPLLKVRLIFEHSIEFPGEHLAGNAPAEKLKRAKNGQDYGTVGGIIRGTIVRRISRVERCDR